MADESKINGIAWFIAGISVGALVGLLYAPKSGRETREDITGAAREGAEYLRARGKDAAEYASDLYGKGKEYANDYVDRGREYVDRGRAQWGEFVERGRNLVNEQSTRVAAAVDAGRQAYRSAVTTPAEEHAAEPTAEN